MKKRVYEKIAAAVSAAVLAVTAMAPFTVETSAAELTGLTANEITSQMVIGWNLGNTLDCKDTGLSYYTSPERFATAWGQPAPNAGMFAAVQEEGFNTVRIPTTWYEHIQWDASSQMYLINDSWMDYVKQTVDYAYDRGMFVILNMHHENFINVSQFTDSTYQDASKKMTDIWTQIAEEFAEYDQHLIFEGMNEPRQTGLGGSVEWGSGDNNSRAYINKLNAVFVDTVRKQGSEENQERLLMIPGYVASYEKDALNGIQIPANAGNVAISVHAYAPYFFTMATDSYANHNFPGKSGYGEDYEYALTNLFNNLKTVSKQKNAPIIIGEFGASDFNNTTSRVNWAKSYLTKAKAAGIPCVLWDNNIVGRSDGEAHGYLNRSSNTWYSQSVPVLNAMMEAVGTSTGSTTPDPTTPQTDAPAQPTGSVFDNVTVGSDWVQLYLEEAGENIAVWGNTPLPGWEGYMDGSYDFVMVYDSSTKPELVVQGKDDSWNRIASSDASNTPNVKKFTYEDIKKVIGSMTTDQIHNIFISATEGGMTAYAVYAVPKASAETTAPAETTKAASETTTSETTTTETTTTTATSAATTTTTSTTAAPAPETTTTTTSTTTETSSAPTQPAEQSTETAEEVKGDVNEDGSLGVVDVLTLRKYLMGNDVKVSEQADVNKDGSINIFDLALLKKLVLSSK